MVKMQGLLEKDVRSLPAVYALVSDGFGAARHVWLRVWLLEMRRRWLHSQMPHALARQAPWTADCEI